MKTMSITTSTLLFFSKLKQIKTSRKREKRKGKMEWVECQVVVWGLMGKG
jgi:hypothetical protein